MLDILKIADDADMVVNGYAYTIENDCVRVLNLNNPNRACVMMLNGDVIETTMDDIEVEIVLEYFERNRKYVEEK